MIHAPQQIAHRRSRRSARTRGIFRLASVATAGLFVTALAACSGSPAQSPSSGETSGSLSIVATTTQLADFAREVSGSEAKVTGLLPAGASAHHFDPSPKDLLALSSADVLIVNGAGLEGFIDAAIDASGFEGTVITAADGIDLEKAAHIGEDAADEHVHEGHDEHEHDGHDGHDHGAVNPHLWTSPTFAAQMVSEIARGLAAADPAHSDEYLERSRGYEARLSALDEWASAQFERVPPSERVLVSGHNSLSYYLHDYGITFAGSIMPSFEDNAEPSAQAIDDLVATIDRLGVKAIFVESSMSPKLASTIAREAGVTVVGADGGATLYADTLGSPGSGAESYIDATVHNTQLILTAWGYPVDPLPQGIGAQS